MRVLFLIPHPEEGPSSRYRVLQYIPQFEVRGIHCDVSPFLSKAFYHIAYKRGHFFKKLGHLCASLARRARDVFRARQYDLVFIHLGALPAGPPVIEWILHALKIPFVYDLDDALFLNKGHIGRVLSWSRHVITCNDYLKEYALRFNKDVTMIPTSLNTERFKPAETRMQNKKPVIGWIGSHSTAGYLEMLKPVLSRLARKHAFTFKVVGAARPFSAPGVDVVQEDWSLKRDIELFQELDIGAYPLPDEPWVLGKTGFKTIQYMSVGVPCVVSDVGRNREVVADGINGFLAGTEEEWAKKLEILLTQRAVRDRFAAEGVKTVEKRFSMQAQIPRYLAIMKHFIKEEEQVPHAEPV